MFSECLQSSKELSLYPHVVTLTDPLHVSSNAACIHMQVVTLTDLRHVSSLALTPLALDPRGTLVEGGFALKQGEVIRQAISFHLALWNSIFFQFEKLKVEGGFALKQEGRRSDRQFRFILNFEIPFQVKESIVIEHIFHDSEILMCVCEITQRQLQMLLQLCFCHKTQIFWIPFCLRELSVLAA